MPTASLAPNAAYANRARLVGDVGESPSFPQPNTPTMNASSAMDEKMRGIKIEPRRRPQYACFPVVWERTAAGRSLTGRCRARIVR